MVGAQDRQHEVDHALVLRYLRQDVQAVTDLDVLDLAQPAVDMHDEVVELLLSRAFLKTKVLVHLGGLDELPDFALEGRCLRRIHHGDIAVLVE